MDPETTSPSPVQAPPPKPSENLDGREDLQVQRMIEALEKRKPEPEKK